MCHVRHPHINHPPLPLFTNQDENKQKQVIEAKECTFKPRLNVGKGKFAYVAPKFDKISEKIDYRENLAAAANIDPT